ncbi:hypothetical protein, conserved [Plasmodium gonderi]|uniref:Uncharacterized protein n=1 Tax=Plasmodium gonderi TaxID=77519 RepID=A0A1Y1JEJ9_PLAGO|nr:hypothetical protein, conserved [Plasmodium gonderi]GAW79637.1 hypothetical protein, conserved [Plasmodium gonderi]
MQDNKAQGIRSSKEPFRRMNYELRPRGNRVKSYRIPETFSSSDGEVDKSYYDEVKYLNKDQMKAYICKMKKEIDEYKMREMNYVIEIKYLRRKIERLKGMLENDKFLLKHQRAFSLRSQDGFSLKSGINEINSEYTGSHSRWYKRNNISEGNFRDSSFTQKYRGGGEGCYNYRFRKDSFFDERCSNVSIKRINDSIHKNKPMSVNNFTDGCREISRRSEGNQMIFPMKAKKERNHSSSNSCRINSMKDNYVKSHNISRSGKNDKKMNMVTMGRGFDPLLSNRSYSSTSKFQLKKHLISNSNNIRNMSTDINSTITKDIKNYYNSKQSIMSGASQKMFSASLASVRKFSNLYNGREGRTHFQKECFSIKNLSKLTPNEIKKKLNCDLFDYAHHQRILSKKYISPYAFKKKTNMSRISICKKGIQHSGSNTNSATLGKNNVPIPAPCEGKEIISRPTEYLSNQNDKADSDCVKNTEEMQNDEKMDESQDSTDSIKRIKSYLDTQRGKKNSSCRMNKQGATLTSQRSKEISSRTVLTNRGTLSNRNILTSKSEKHTDQNLNTNNAIPVKLRDGAHLKKEEKKKKPNVHTDVKKNVDVGIKSIFKKELEELKRRKDILISKRNDCCDISFGSSSSSSKSSYNFQDDKVGHEHVENREKISSKQSKTMSNPLKESNILNISFNDLDKRISNLKNYLKNTNK